MCQKNQECQGQQELVRLRAELVTFTMERQMRMQADRLAAQRYAELLQEKARVQWLLSKVTVVLDQGQPVVKVADQPIRAEDIANAEAILDHCLVLAKKEGAA